MCWSADERLKWRRQCQKKLETCLTRQHTSSLKSAELPDEKEELLAPEHNKGGADSPDCYEKIWLC